MSFTTHVFIRKNTPDLREKLQQIGHRICVCCKFKGNDWLKVSAHHGVHGIGEDEEWSKQMFIDENKIYIDCGTDERLFLILAALRDDSDYMQWFIVGDNCFVQHKGRLPYPKGLINSGMSSKATAEELIQHFNNLTTR